MPWSDAVRQLERDSTSRTQTAENQYFTRSTLYPEELWKLARTLRPGEVSFVVKTEAGYAVLHVNGIRHQGETPDFSYVRDEIRDRLLIDVRRKRYDRLVSDLRSHHSVEVAPDSTGGSRPEGG
jgi:parvulin-like peptidyl-prolyl isomerase